MPDEGGQLWTFTDVYQVDVSNTRTPILTMYPLLTGLHVPDKNICIPPNIFIRIHNNTVKGNKSKQEAYEYLKDLFLTKLLQSKSNQAGCKHFVSGLFIAYPEKYMVNPLGK